MVQSQYSIQWESFKSSVCKGFSSLQQNSEFVDMTIAADGYFVKVHRVMMALVSPYLKELMSLSPCEHPIIFLTDVSHSILTLLLEYIYTGEVVVPTEHLIAFAKTAKKLHIKGLEDFSKNMAFPKSEKRLAAEGNTSQASVQKRPAEFAYSEIRQPVLPAAAKNIMYTGLPTLYSPVKQHEQTVSQPKDDMMDYLMLEDTIVHDSDDDMKADNQMDIMAAAVDSKDNSEVASIQFTVSIRGSLQIILNRYIYNLHSVQHRTGVRRWRCVNYRDSRCQAFVVTNGNVVLSRANLHNHAYHDKKILQKIEKKAVFTAIEEVEGYKESLKATEQQYDNFGESGTDDNQDKEKLSQQKLKVEIN